MNWDQVESNWKQLSVKVKAKWDKFTDYELTLIAGRRKQLAGLIQSHYRIGKNQAEKDADDFARTLSR